MRTRHSLAKRTLSNAFHLRHLLHLLHLLNLLHLLHLETPTCAHAAKTESKLATTARDMEAIQIIGDYKNIPIQSTTTQQCPDAINITRVETIQSVDGVLYVIPHRYITLPQQGGTVANCLPTPVTSDISPESATVLRRDTQITLDRNNSLIDTFALAQERFFIGVELGPRVCNLLTVASGTASMWMAPDRSLVARVDSQFSVNFKPGSKYIFFFDETSPCLFRGDARQVGTPVEARSPTPSATVTPTPSPIPSRTPVASVIPSASSSAMVSLAPPLQPPPPPLQPVGDASSVSTVPSYSESRSVCFPGSARVSRADRGGFVEMAIHDLRVGDRVLVGKGDRSSPVFGFTHQVADVRTRMVALRTEGNETLTLSAAHYVYVRESVGGVKTVKRADAVRIGEFLIGLDGDIRVRCVDVEVSAGLFNPQTFDGDIVVNGFLVTTYTAVLDDFVAAHAALVVWRAVERLLPGIGIVDRLRCRLVPGEFGVCLR